MDTLASEMNQEEVDAWYKAVKSHGDFSWPCTIIHHSKERAEKEMVDFSRLLTTHGWIIEGSSPLLDGFTPEGKKFWRRFYYASKPNPEDTPKKAQNSHTEVDGVGF
jgi:hypothetical protein